MPRLEGRATGLLATPGPRAQEHPREHRRAERKNQNGLAGPDGHCGEQQPDETRALGATRASLEEAHWKVTVSPSVKFEVGVGFWSRYQQEKCQVSPGCTATNPVGRGKLLRSTWML